MSEPLRCPNCDASGAQRPGFELLPLPEAVGVNEFDMVPVHSLRCRSCDHRFLVPVGMLDVRKPSDAAR